MPSYIDSVDVTIQSVQESYRQNGRENVWDKVPLCFVGDERTGHKDTTYRLPDLDVSLLKAQLLAVPHDADPPKASTMSSSTLTISPEYLQTQVLSNPDRDSEVHRLRDLENLIPMHLDRINIGLDLLVLAAMENSTKFTSNSWNGTGALDTYASDHNPAKDINNDLRTFRKWQSMTGLSLECFMDREVATLLAGYEDYQTAMYASSGRQFQDVDAVAAAMARIHSLDNVTIYNGVYDTVQDGQTSSADRIGAGLLWFGLVDRRQSEFDLTEGGQFGPDGAICLGMGSPIHVVDWREPGKEVEFTNARCSAHAYQPRYDADSTVFGMYYPAAQNFT
jgi:hypothetical protein